MKGHGHDYAANLAARQQHTYTEFVLKDVNAALATMTDDPMCSSCPAGPAGRDGRVHAFYADQWRFSDLARCPA